MRKLFLTILLWFWATLFGIGLLFIGVITHAGLGRAGSLGRLLFHDSSLFCVAGGIFCFFVSSYITRPLHRLGEAAAAIAEGRLETRVDPSLKKRRDEIAELARNFDGMAERIEGLVTAQRRLLGDVSHELRSPLARLMVALSLARKGPAEEAPEHLDRIGAEARRMDQLIGQLLTLTRIDSAGDRETPVPFDLTNLVQEVANDADFEARAHNRRVSVMRVDSATVKGFEELLRSAVENVVRNAIRYTAPGTAVEISLENDASRTILRVRDYGPGVPEGRIPEMFHPFRRLTAHTSDGAGLGLAIAERAVSVHHGKITAKNEDGSGLAVEIALPLELP